jgi:hypothetical protein
MERWNWDDVAAMQIAERFRGWTNCVSRGAIDELSRYLHPDFVYVSVFGHRYDKTGYLVLASSVVPGAPYEVHRVCVRVDGKIALVDGEYLVSGATEQGDDLTAHTRFSGTWICIGSLYVAMSHHGTRYAPCRDAPDT